MPRPKTVLVNPYREQLIEVYLEHDLPYWLDDVLTGASRTQGSTTISPMMLLTILTIYDSISTLEIKTFLNRKREAIEGRSVSDESYLRDIRRACACAVDAITHQLTECGKHWDTDPYLRGDIKMMLSPFRGKQSR